MYMHLMQEFQNAQGNWQKILKEEVDIFTVTVEYFNILFYTIDRITSLKMSYYIDDVNNL